MNDRLHILASPLIERTPKVPIPGIISSSRYWISNGATILSREPLTVKMPAQPWAYGVRFPIEQRRLSSRSPHAPCVASLKLDVQGGVVGVAACNAEGSAFTTPESIASGDSEVNLTLTQLEQTAAVVIRNTAGVDSTSVTIREIGVYELGEERLAGRGHDLGYDLFLILSRNKTGTQTIESTLKALSSHVRVHRVHCASPEGTLQLRGSASELESALGRENEMTKSWNFQAEVGDLARADIATVRRHGGRVAFLTAVREPIGLAVSEMFQFLPLLIPAYSDLYQFKGAVFAQMLADGLVASWERELEQTSSLPASHMLWRKCLQDCNYVNDEFHAVTGFDLLAHRFDIHQGYARVDQGNDVAYVFRTSELGRSLPSALAELTGHHVERLSNSNFSAEKSYAALYEDVLQRLRVSARLAEAIYRRHAYITHFFDKAEIDNLIRRWSMGAGLASK